MKVSVQDLRFSLQSINHCLLGCDAMQSSRQEPIFCRTLSSTLRWRLQVPLIHCYLSPKYTASTPRRPCICSMPSSRYLTNKSKWGYLFLLKNWNNLVTLHLVPTDTVTVILLGEEKHISLGILSCWDIPMNATPCSVVLLHFEDSK